MKITEELKVKALACETVEELLALAKENDIELSPEETELILQDMTEASEGELADNELEGVAGGGGCGGRNTYDMVYWNTEVEVQFIFKEGDIVEAFPPLLTHHTATCKVVSLKTCYDENHGWYDVYWLEKQPGVKTPFIKGNTTREEIQK